MKISDLSYSPSAMYLNGMDEILVSEQSKLYQLDKKTTTRYCRILKTFYPLLIKELSSSPKSLLSRQQWLVLSKSIIQIFFVFLVDMTITAQVQKKHKLTDDVKAIPSFCPQTQEMLMQALAYDRELQKRIFSVAWQAFHDGITTEEKQVNWFDAYSFNNLKYYLAKKLFRPQFEFPKTSKPKIGLLETKGLEKYFDPQLRIKYDFIELDPLINSLYSFPKFPNLKYRSQIKLEIESCLARLNLSHHFSIFRGKKHSASLLAQLMATLLPIQDLEGFNDNRLKIEAIVNILKPSLILTSTGQHDDLSNLFLSSIVKQQIPLITFQHGSGYCEFLSMQAQRTIETCLYPSLYLAWGKGLQSNCCHSLVKIKALGSPYLNNIEGHKFKKTIIRKILIPLESINFYQMEDGFIPSQPGFISTNYQTLIKVLETIEKKYPHLTYVFKIKAGHKKQYSLIRRYLSPQLKKKVVFAHVGSTFNYFDSSTLVFLPIRSGAFNEALMGEIPFVLYLPPNQTFAKDWALNFFSVLKKHHLAASTVKQLVEAIEYQINNQVDYKHLRLALKKYQQRASLRNPHLKRQLSNIIERSLFTKSSQ